MVRFTLSAAFLSMSLAACVQQSPPRSAAYPAFNHASGCGERFVELWGHQKTSEGRCYDPSGRFEAIRLAEQHDHHQRWNRNVGVRQGTYGDGDGGQQHLE